MAGTLDDPCGSKWDAAVAAAVSNGDITLSEAAEVAKLIDAYVRAYKAAELDDRTAPIRQLSDAELLRIAMGGHQTDGTPTPQSPKLLILNSR